KLPDLIKAQRAGNNLLVNVDPLVDEISQLVDNYDALEKKSHAFAWLGYGLGVLGLLVLVALGHHLVSEARARAQVSAAQHKVERDAVIRLRHEIRTLGEGDLTVRATIDKKESTAAIAEAVNYMVSALRELVTAINDAAGEVASAAAETRATALHLTRGSQRQVEQISSVTAAVHNFAVAMEQVASGAQASLDVAQQSVEIADHGANAVRQVIHAMVTTREHIQDTAKRIKRLGESSQEIGNIVELINDIADQTHILALNAAIQTHSGVRNASIGTVADEVQQLAERTGYATRQIEVLVKVIQQDTQEAVMSMARSTHDVVEGTELAEGAGTALIAIQDVSVDLAGHIQNISHTAQQLARDAMEVASSMNVIKDVTNENLVGTKQAAELTENLALLSHTLRQMVSGFKLPNISVDS
ncbi:MAG: methyl-accepting chemotaxis protein, partial [Gammaproteobacteria bacterium]|nr:methyl-accepting chemotaxis protein [Gammaproteobacteria bacterium]